MEQGENRPMDPLDEAISTASSHGTKFGDTELVRSMLLKLQEEGQSTVVYDMEYKPIKFTKQGNGFKIDIPDEK